MGALEEVVKQYTRAALLHNSEGIAASAAGQPIRARHHQHLAAVLSQAVAGEHEAAKRYVKSEPTKDA
jgi:hypothetical protein